MLAPLLLGLSLNLAPSGLSGCHRAVARTGHPVASADRRPAWRAIGTAAAALFVSGTATVRSAHAAGAECEQPTVSAAVHDTSETHEEVTLVRTTSPSRSPSPFVKLYGERGARRFIDKKFIFDEDLVTTSEITEELEAHANSLSTSRGKRALQMVATTGGACVLGLYTVKGLSAIEQWMQARPPPRPRVGTPCDRRP